jgi:hypothetical protein
MRVLPDKNVRTSIDDTTHQGLLWFSRLKAGNIGLKV